MIVVFRFVKNIKKQLMMICRVDTSPFLGFFEDFEATWCDHRAFSPSFSSSKKRGGHTTWPQNPQKTLKMGMCPPDISASTWWRISNAWFSFLGMGLFKKVAHFRLFHTDNLVYFTIRKKRVDIFDGQNTCGEDNFILLKSTWFFLK